MNNLDFILNDGEKFSKNISKLKSKEKHKTNEENHLITTSKLGLNNLDNAC